MSAKHIAEKLPHIDELKKRCQSLAMLDAILSPEWEYRYYSFSSKWSDGQMMASMRDGAGDGYFILFTPDWVAIKGFVHDAEMSPWNDEHGQVWPGVLEQVPDELVEFLAEPAFSMQDTTFCIWRRLLDDQWKTGNVTFPNSDDPDGAKALLGILTGTVLSYQTFARDYYEVETSITGIEHVYKHRPLTDEIVVMLNPAIKLKDITDDIDEIAYPKSSLS